MESDIILFAIKFGFYEIFKIDFIFVRNLVTKSVRKFISIETEHSIRQGFKDGWGQKLTFHKSTDNRNERECHTTRL